MNNKHEEHELCQAFNQLFHSISDLREVEKKSLFCNIEELMKCKVEIENLLSAAKISRDKSTL